MTARHKKQYRRHQRGLHAFLAGCRWGVRRHHGDAIALIGKHVLKTRVARAALQERNE